MKKNVIYLVLFALIALYGSYFHARSRVYEKDIIFLQNDNDWLSRQNSSLKLEREDYRLKYESTFNDKVTLIQKWRQSLKERDALKETLDK